MNRSLFMEAPTARQRMAYAWELVCEMVKAGKSVRVRIDEQKPTRSLEQNDKMWAMLSDISAQVQWPVDGKMIYMPDEDWKDVLSAGLKHEQRVAQGINGGFVMLGQRTSKMKIGEMADLIELMYAFGSERGVVWTEAEFRKAA